MQQMGIIMLQVEQAVTHLEQNPDCWVFVKSCHCKTCPSLGKLLAAGGRSMLVGHITCSGLAASAASGLGQSRGFQKSVGKAGSQTQ